jgi:hypothetical protein
MMRITGPHYPAHSTHVQASSTITHIRICSNSMLHKHWSIDVLHVPLAHLSGADGFMDPICT